MPSTIVWCQRDMNVNRPVVLKTLFLFWENAKVQIKVESMPELCNKTMFFSGLPGRNLFRTSLSTLKSRFKKDLNLQINLHKTFFRMILFYIQYMNFFDQTWLDLWKENSNFLNREILFQKRLEPFVSTQSQKDVIFFVSVCRTIFVSLECLKILCKEKLSKKLFSMELKSRQSFCKNTLNLDQWF